MTAQPTEDPADPLVILRDLPEREHEEFLRQYHQAVDAAHDPAGYQQLRRLLHVWSLTAVAAGQPGYYEELAAARAGTATTCRSPTRSRTGPNEPPRPGTAGDLPGRTERPGTEADARASQPGIRRLIEAMAEVIDYPDDPLRTFPTGDPYVRRVEFGDSGLITYLINDGTSLVIILDITWVG